MKTPKIVESLKRMRFTQEEAYRLIPICFGVSVAVILVANILLGFALGWE